MNCGAVSIAIQLLGIGPKACGVKTNLSDHCPAHGALSHRDNLSWTGMPDIERLTRKLDRRKASLADLCQLYRASSKLAGITAAMRDHAGEHTQLLVTRCGGRHARHFLLLFVVRGTSAPCALPPVIHSSD